ncbi:uncharacterized protein DDB_G0285291-like isoform X2 [Achroia grisella]|uniref:uncharacterized protein DDB_G0285291-like isoform X2 n=1 Tax=Achroia grisella TaxID=688607 RepID=UPI0027D1FFC6|nr:uncharacterized protein DDB_G0285291-like isoform X2 [Achroia grisella]
MALPQMRLHLKRARLLPKELLLVRALLPQKERQWKGLQPHQQRAPQRRQQKALQRHQLRALQRHLQQKVQHLLPKGRHQLRVHRRRLQLLLPQTVRQHPYQLLPRKGIQRRHLLLLPQKHQRLMQQRRLLLLQKHQRLHRHQSLRPRRQRNPQRRQIHHQLKHPHNPGVQFENSSCSRNRHCCRLALDMWSNLIILYYFYIN